MANQRSRASYLGAFYVTAKSHYKAIRELTADIEHGEYGEASERLLEALRELNAMISVSEAKYELLLECGVTQIDPKHVSSDN